MRVHRLTMTAFGPFADTHTVDFDELGAQGLFLVHGPTGAGKTSVLDALCFALFADVPGSRSHRGVRCDLSPPDRATSVELEFTASGRRLRIVRRPEQVRPKLRGSGTRRTPASVVVHELRSGRWEARSTRLDEAANVINDVIGMGLAQFQRIALLPQGGFATFLRADARDRHALLTALFDVTAFEDVETWLADQRRASAGRLATAEQELAFGVRALGDLLVGQPPIPAAMADEPPPWPTDPAQDPAVWAGGVPALRSWLDRAQTAAVNEQERARTASESARDAVAAAAQLQRSRERGLRARVEAAAVEDAGASVETLRRERDTALKAGDLRGEILAAQRAETAHRDLQAQFADAALALARAVPDDRARDWFASGSTAGAGASGAVMSTCQELRRTLSAGSAELADLPSVAGRLAGAASVLAGHNRAQAAAQTAIDDANQRLEKLRERQRKIKAALADCAALAGAASARQVEHDRCRSAVQLRTQCAVLDEQLRGADQHTRLLERQELDARAAVLTLDEARLADLAAELADGLVPDAPCPVCGSEVHPSPAPTAGGWSPTALADAKKAATMATAALADAKAEASALSARREVAHARLAELRCADLSADELQKSLESSRLALAAARDAEVQLLRLTAEHDDVTVTIEQVRRDETDAHVAFEVSTAALAAVRRDVQQAVTGGLGAVARHTTVCLCGGDSAGQAGGAGDLDRGRWSDDPSIDELVAAAAHVTSEVRATQRQHARLTAEVEAIAGLAERLLTAADELGRAQAAVAEALTGSAFSTAEAALAAWRSESVLSNLSARIEDHERRGAAAHVTLAEPEVIAALAADPPDVAGLVKLAEAAEQRAVQAARMRHGLERTTTMALSLLAGIDKAARETLTRREEHLAVAALADLAAGTSPENTLRMRLSTFVLAARLERVVELANERLARMGDGRFALIHDDSLARGGARSGLGLLVRDEWSGTTRAPTTLSGGESFMASLALALGLADVLRESVGGVELETLFIDEGFGSLDEVSLDDVLGVLDELRDGGRAVGVVSHLAELRDRIPNRLAVGKASTGSTVTQHLAATASA